MTDLLLLGDYPAPNDPRKEFKDAHGRFLWWLLYINKVNVRQVATDFLYDRPQDIRMGTPKFAQIMTKHKPKVIVALGQQALKDLGIQGSLVKMRGSVIPQKLGNHSYYVIPTYNPRDMKLPERMFADEPVERGFVSSGDIRKAWEVVKGGWVQPREIFNLEPTLQDVKDFCRVAKEENAILGMDIESTGLNTDYVDVDVLGIALDEERCLVIPFSKEGGQRYWSLAEEGRVRELLKDLMHSNRLMFQNGTGYDVPLLIKRGWEFPIEQFTDDTMVLHHVIAPELPHNIGFISSQYGKQQYWKESFLSRKEHIYDTDQIEMRLYNARDCVALHQIRNGMMNHIGELIESEPEIYGELLNVYKLNMEASWVSIDMTLTGIAISKDKIYAWQKNIGGHLAQIERELQELYPLPDSFNWGSQIHKRLLLYSEIPPALQNDDWKKSIEAYDTVFVNYQYECTECGRKVTNKGVKDGTQEVEIDKRCPACKTIRRCIRTEKEPTSVKAKSKDTQVYKKLEILQELSEIKPLPKLRGYEPLETKGNNSALDGAAMERYISHIYRRLEAIEAMKTSPARCVVEAEDLNLTLRMLVLIEQLNKYKKLVESFWDFETGRDGRVHPSYLVTGTSTGRWSCKKPNLN